MRRGQELSDRVLAHVQKEEMSLLPVIEENMDPKTEARLYQEYVENALGLTCDLRPHPARRIRPRAGDRRAGRGRGQDRQPRAWHRSNADGLARALRENGAQSLQSEARWSNHALLRFFEASGVSLAPRLVLERTTQPPLPEAIDAA